MDGTPLSETEFKRRITVAWWDPDVAATLDLALLQFLRDLPWWRPRFRQLLSDSAIAQYELAYLQDAQEQFPISPPEDVLEGITDPLERVRVVDAAWRATREAEWSLAELRRQSLLDAGVAGVQTQVLADVVRTSTANIRQVIGRVKREAKRSRTKASPKSP